MGKREIAKRIDLGLVKTELKLDDNNIKSEKTRLLKQQKLFALRELRRLANRTQIEVSNLMGVTQNRVSKLERYELEKLELRTLVNFVEALGGNLKINVSIADQDFEIVLNS